MAVNLVVMALLASVLSYEVSFLQWTALGVPISIIALICVSLFAYLYFLRNDDTLDLLGCTLNDKYDELGPMTRYEHIATATILCALFLWCFGPALANSLGWTEGAKMLTSPFIAILMGSACFLIPLKKDKETKKIVFAMDWNQGMRNISWDVLILALGVLVFGKVLLAGGIDQWVAALIQNVLGDVSGLLVWFLLILLSSLASQFILLITCIVFILSYFLRVFPAVLSLDIANDLSINLTQVGVFSSTTMLAYGLMQLPSGILADSFGAKKTIVLLTVLAGSFTILFSFSSNITVMTTSRFITGFGVAITVPALAMLARCFPPHMYARAASIFLSCAGIGGILAAPPLVALSNSIGWRNALLLFAGFTLFMALFVFIFIPENPKSENQSSEIKKKMKFKDILIGLGQIFKTKEFWPLMLWLMCNGGVFFTLSSFWWGPYFMEAQGLTKEQTGLVLMLSSLTLLITQPILGYLSDVIFKSRKKPVMFLSFIGIFTTFFICFTTGEVSLSIIIIQIIFFQLSVVTAVPIIFTMVKESFPLHLVGTASGCINMFYPIWASVLQVLFGSMLNNKLATGSSIEDAYSFAFILVIANVIVGFCMTLFMKETYTKISNTTE